MNGKGENEDGESRLLEGFRPQDPGAKDEKKDDDVQDHTPIKRLEVVKDKFVATLRCLARNQSLQPGDVVADGFVKESGIAGAPGVAHRRKCAESRMVDAGAHAENHPTPHTDPIAPASRTSV